MKAMPVEYTNKKGKTYYLHQGMTKNQKVRFYFSRKTEGDLVDVMPDGYEVYCIASDGIGQMPQLS